MKRKENYAVKQKIKIQEAFFFFPRFYAWNWPMRNNVVKKKQTFSLEAAYSSQ